MGFFNFIVAMLLLGIGLAIAIYLTWTMTSPFLGSMRGRKGGSKIRRAQERLKKVDQLLADQKAAEALKVLRKSLLLDAALTSANISRLKEHHQNMLSRCLVIAEELGSRAENIAEAERLLMERIELQGLLFKASDSFENLRGRREKAGKELPTWSKSDFESRIKEINQELKKNETAAVAAVERLFASLSSPSEDDDNIVYH